MNYNLSLLRSLYFAASGKYQKFRVRFDKAIQTGRFHKLSKRKQSSLVSRLKKLYERLKSLQTQLRLAGAGAALALTLSVSNPALAQSSLGPFERNDAANPLPPPYFIDRPRPAVVDIDNDGDLDIFIGNANGDIEFFRNPAGATTVRRFTQVTGSSNPFDGINKGPQAAPAFVDVDGDLDFDMLLGTGYGNTFFFRNTGSRTNPAFTEQTGINNPFDGITGTTSKYGIERAIPVFVDIDEDSDQDLFIGSSYTSDYYGPHYAVKFYANTSGNFAPSFHNLTGYLSNFYSTAITFADLDENGDLDVLVSDGFGPLRCFVECSGGEFCEQTGPWNPVTRTGNPMHYSYFTNGSPVLADFDGDGDLDIIVGQVTTNNTSVVYYENTDGAYTFQIKNDLNISPLGGVDVGEEAAPVFVDLDNDNDLDVVIGEKYSNPGVSVYVNNNGEFFADPDNPLSDLSLGYDNIPVFVDIDNDSDKDLFVCKGYNISFFRNNSGTFTSETTLFPTLNSGNSYELSLAFLDVDNDGDLDALMGNDRYGQPKILYFQNTGTATTPNFTSATPPAPFTNPIFEHGLNLVASDLDHDGDTDIALSETYYVQSGYNGDRTKVRFFENNSAGGFSEAPEPIIAYGSPKYSYTSFADLDGDGDLDAFMGNGSNGYGNGNGRIDFFENSNPAPLTATETSELTVIGGTPIIIAPALTITDLDNDDITFATVTISDFVPGGEVLGFTPQAGITGVFDDEGVLTFVGKAPIATYETLLRSVTIDFTGTVPGGRQSKAASVLNLLQTITFEVRDTDFTLTTVSIVSINILPGNELTIYNAISPNKEDDANAFFKIAAIEIVSPENTVTIYNRWGDVVFEVNNYNNSEPSKRFEGVNKNGKDLPSGTYFYKIEITGKTITGYLSLKR